RHPRSTLFPYTTLFRSALGGAGEVKGIRDDNTFKKSLAQVGKNPAAIAYVDVQRVLKQVDTIMRNTGAGEEQVRQFTQVRDALRSEEHTSELQSPCNLV